jgi:hypothetical protein
LAFSEVVAEWSKAGVCKTPEGNLPTGSNPVYLFMRDVKWTWDCIPEPYHQILRALSHELELLGLCVSLQQPLPSWSDEDKYCLMFQVPIIDSQSNLSVCNLFVCNLYVFQDELRLYTSLGKGEFTFNLTDPNSIENFLKRIKGLQVEFSNDARRVNYAR